MEDGNLSRNDSGSGEEVIEIDPPGVAREQMRELEAEGDEIWAALQQRVGSTECIAISAIVVLAVITIYLFVILILVLTGNLCA